MKKVAFIILMIIAGISNAQNDSTDLNFYATAPIWENDGDSLFYPAEYFNAYILEFDITDLQNIEKIHFELYMVESGQVLYRKAYTISQLVESGLISNNNVKISFGNFESGHLYKVSVVVENSSGVLGKSISKTLTE